MKIAQELYEGIDLGEGRTGLITYMRTDSTRISDEAQKQCQGYIGDTLGSKYLGPGPKSKQKANVQGAHEAIRPTDVSRTAGSHARDPVRRPAQVVFADLESVRGEFHGAGRLRLGARLDRGRVSTCSRRPVPRLPSRVFTRCAGTGRQRYDSARACRGRGVEAAQARSAAALYGAAPTVTEASLVKELEELGIGRPSTYVPIISTIQQRKYVKLENRRFVPLELGETVNRLMKQHFPDIVDVKFTAQVESGLDQVEDGEREWTDLLK